MSWLWAAGAYLCGSIPFGLLIVRAVSGADVRTVGSGNIGATNVARAAGRPAAIATLVLDALKGLVPVLMASRTEQAPPMLASGCAVAAAKCQARRSGSARRASASLRWASRRASNDTAW